MATWLLASYFMGFYDTELIQSILWLGIIWHLICLVKTIANRGNVSYDFVTIDRFTATTCSCIYINRWSSTHLLFYYNKSQRKRRTHKCCSGFALCCCCFFFFHFCHDKYKILLWRCRWHWTSHSVWFRFWIHHWKIE